MERMSGADALMLYLDRAAAYNHTIKLSIVDPSEDPEGWSWQRFKWAFGTRVGLVPRLRQRYLRVPFGLNHPVWVEDPDFDLDYHLMPFDGRSRFSANFLPYGSNGLIDQCLRYPGGTPGAGAAVAAARNSATTSLSST